MQTAICVELFVVGEGVVEMWLMFFMHASVGLSLALAVSLYFSSLTATIHLFFFSFNIYIYSRSTSTNIYTSRRQRRATTGFSPLILFIRQEKSEGGEERKKDGKNVDEQYSSLTRLVKCITKFFLLTDTQRSIKFHSV